MHRLHGDASKIYIKPEVDPNALLLPYLLPEYNGIQNEATIEPDENLVQLLGILDFSELLLLVVLLALLSQTHKQNAEPSKDQASDEDRINDKQYLAPVQLLLLFDHNLLLGVKHDNLHVLVVVVVVVVVLAVESAHRDGDLPVEVPFSPARSVHNKLDLLRLTISDKVAGGADDGRETCAAGHLLAVAVALLHH